MEGIALIIFSIVGAVILMPIILFVIRITKFNKFWKWYLGICEIAENGKDKNAKKN